MASKPGFPRRGEIWLADLGTTIGREQAGKRPVLVLSQDVFNQGPAELHVVVPLTTTERGIPLHVEIKPPTGGFTKKSYAMCENLRSVSRDRLTKRLGIVDRRVMFMVEERLHALLEL